MNEEVSMGTDKHGNNIRKGSRIKIVGRQSDAVSVYFPDEMIRYLNDDKTYIVRTIYKKDNGYTIKLQETDWQWCSRNVVSLSATLPPPPKIEPVLFETNMLDI